MLVDVAAGGDPTERDGTVDSSGSPTSSSRPGRSRTAWASSRASSMVVVIASRKAWAPWARSAVQSFSERNAREYSMVPSTGWV